MIIKHIIFHCKKISNIRTFGHSFVCATDDYQFTMSFDPFFEHYKKATLE